MNTNGRVQTSQLEGMVEAVNATGLKLGGAWLNVSRFKPVELPTAGSHVRLEVDSRGYIKELEVLNGNGKTPAVVSEKDERITRLAVLKAAAEFVGLWGQTREDIKSDHVLVIADKWVKWIEGE